MIRVVVVCALSLAACAHATTQDMPADDDGARDGSAPRKATPEKITSDDIMPDRIGRDLVEFHDIVLPRTPTAGQRVLLEVDVGAIGSGQEIALRTPDDLLIGTISPHGIRPGNAAGTYVVPVSPDALKRASYGKGLRVRMRIERAGAPARPVRADEVRSVRAVVVD